MSVASDFQDKELLQAAVWPPSSKDKLIELPVPVQLTDRRLYCYVEVKQSVTNAVFFLNAEIVCYLKGQIIGKYPVEIGTNTTSATVFSKTLRCLANAGGSPVGDCLTLVFVSPFTATTLNAICQPIRFEAEMDSVVLNFKEWNGASNTGFRAYLGVLSQKA